jgi:molybdopterin-binding protein
MKLSARNQMPGKVTEVKKGATTTVVKVEVPSPAYMTASITNEAAEDLGLKAGDNVVVTVKASEVILGKS